MTARTGLDFDEFVEFQFGPAVRSGGNAWYFDPDCDWWEPDPRTGIAYLTRLFTQGRELLEPFSDVQVAQGLTGLMNTMAVGDQPWMRDPATPPSERAEAWTAMVPLFANVLAPRCVPVLGHLAKVPPPAIDTVTYMWWESLPGFTNPGDPGRALIDEAELDALERVLALDSVACQEAALHGLGHLASRQPRSAEIIDAYLKSGGPALPELASYARAARTGCIQ